MGFKFTWAGFWAVLKWAGIFVLLYMSITAAKGIYDDFVKQRDEMIGTTAARVAAEAQLVTLRTVNTRLLDTQRRQADAFAAARLAMDQINTQFSAYRVEQQKALAQINRGDFEESVQANPTGAVQEADTLQDELDRQFEELYR